MTAVPGMPPTGAVLALLAAALWVWPSQRTAVARRTSRLLPAPPTAGGERSGPGAGRRWAMAGAAGVGTGLVLGGAVGLVAGLVVTVAAERLVTRAGRDRSAELRAAMARDLPGTCDLLAVCLSAGMPIGAALAAVGDAVPAPVGRHLRLVAAHSRLGGEARAAWSGVPSPLAPLGRVLVRAGTSGSAAVPALRVLAAEARVAVRAADAAAVGRAGIWVLAPLGLCFLPAFLSSAWFRWCSGSPPTSSADPQPPGPSTDPPDVSAGRLRADTLGETAPTGPPRR